MKYEQIKKGIQNILAAIKDTREQEREKLRQDFIAQQPRLQDKVENRILLEQVINQVLDLKYDLRPSLAIFKEDGTSRAMADYRRTYSLILKVEDSVGRTLGRLGLTLSPQKYIPTEERRTFDPKATSAVKEKASKFMEQTKKKAEEKPIEVKKD